MPAHWLAKSEPAKYAFSQLLKDKKTTWDGVRNFEARNNLRAMKKGDLVLFYHSNEGKEIVGIAKVVKEAYPDPTSDEDWSVVDLAPVKALEAPITLDAIRAHPLLSEMQILKRNRLSVTAVSPEEFQAVLKASKTKL